ncbi:hypothetical protein KAF25_006853 [Fusarium avenaceum]|uniref:Uncharacterized protein n=1 Tax=Fusarium avenaceum TaxID=40199 RepID=A0A9P7KNY5_9HYPO|nr:hypothetical protein KAF25_006853 [Fusarium avenaceum]
MERKSQTWSRLLFPYISAAFASLTFIVIYAGAWKSLDLKLNTSNTDVRSLHDGAFVNLTRRASDYDAAVERGRKLHCLMSISQEEAKQANKGVSLESPEYLQQWPGIEEVEGWSIDVEDDKAPYFQNYLDAAFQGLRIDKELHNEAWANDREGEFYEDPLDPDIDNVQRCWPSGAYFYTSFILEKGVVIGDNALSVMPAFREMYPGLDNLNLPTTHLRQWSDVAWMQWTKACYDTPDLIDTIRYVFQAQITNLSTLGILFEALYKYAGGEIVIGKWNDRITLDVEKDDEAEAFYAFLGSPHGRMTAYLLLNHKERLGVKTINKVDIFVPNIPWTVTGSSVSELARNAKISSVLYVTNV